LKFVYNPSAEKLRSIRNEKNTLFYPAYRRAFCWSASYERLVEQLSVYSHSDCGCFFDSNSDMADHFVCQDVRHRSKAKDHGENRFGYPNAFIEEIRAPDIPVMLVDEKRYTLR
jgi:hypothetical protein